MEEYEGKLFRLDLRYSSDYLTYDLLIDIVKERRYLNVSDIEDLSEIFGNSESQPQYSGIILKNLDYPKTDYNIIALYFHKEDTPIMKYKTFLNDIGVSYEERIIEGVPVIIIPDKNVLPEKHNID